MRMFSEYITDDIFRYEMNWLYMSPCLEHRSEPNAESDCSVIHIHKPLPPHFVLMEIVWRDLGQAWLLEGTMVWVINRKRAEQVPWS